MVSFVLSEKEVPESIALVPNNYNIYLTLFKVWNENKGTAKDLKIKVWVDKGRGGIYKNGENVTIYFVADKDCYLKLYHTNVEGDMQILYPNFYSRNDHVQANQIYTIPNENMSFDFRVIPPFGAEVINAVVSNKPFPPESFSKSEEQVFIPLGKATENNIRSMISRGIAIVPVDMRANDICIFTTVEKLRQ